MASTDRDALVALFNATNGANWTNNTNWNSYAPLSDWYGVNDHNAGRVVSLDLGNNNLAGIFTVSLGVWSLLQFCNLLNLSQELL